MGVRNQHCQFIPQSHVVMGRNIADDLRRGFYRGAGPAPCTGTCQNRILQSFAAVYKSRLIGNEYMPFDGIPGFVTENSDIAVQKLHVFLKGLNIWLFYTGFAGGPGFSEYQLFASAKTCIQRPANPVHKLSVQKTHQIKSEAVNVDLLCPVQNGIHNIIGTHGVLAGNVISTGRAVGDSAVLAYPVIIPGYGTVQTGVQRVGVVVYYIHNDPESSSVKRLNHFFKFPDPHLTMGRICRIGALRNVVVHRVISPVKIRSVRFIHRAVVIHRHQLHIGDSQLLQIIQTGGMNPIPVQCGMIAGKRLVFSPILRREAGGILP